MSIVHPAVSELPLVLQTAFQHLPPSEAQARINSILYADALDLEGIIAVEERNTEQKYIAAMYSQHRPDGSVMLWVPAVPPEMSAAPFYEHLEHYCRKKNTFAAIALADRGQPFDEQELLHIGQFEFLSDLVYLAVQLTGSDEHNQSIIFIPLTGNADEYQYLQTLVSATYADSLDFPRLMSVTPVSQILKGYRLGGLFRQELWFFVQHNGQDIGVLLLTDASPEQMELTYMGLIVDARGQGFANEIVRFAKEVARKWNKTLLLTSVDEKNVPASQAYLKNNFHAWDRKKVYARIY